MALVDHKSSLSTKTELALFSVPSTQVAVERGFNDEIHLSNSCNSEGPWEFRIPPDVHMIDARHNYVHMLLKITKADGSSIRPATPAAGAAAIPHDLIGPINLLGKTFFRNVRVFFSGREVYSANNMYAYRAFLETELNHGWDAKSSHLQAAGYEEDKPGTGIDGADNAGLKLRAKPYERSATVELVAPIHCDVFMQEKFLLPNMDVRLELSRNTDAFCLMSPVVADPAFKIKVESMKWVVRKVEVAPSLALAIESTLTKCPAKYPVRRVHVTSLHLDEGRRTTPINAVLSGQIPRRLLVVLVDSDAFHGVYTKSPFNFKHYKISEAKVSAGGYNYPNVAIKSNFVNGQFTELFSNLFDVLGVGDENKGNGISKARFANGSTILAFDLSPDCDDSGHFELIRQGTTSLHLQFAEAIPAGGCEAVVYAEYDGVLSVDRNRQPNFDVAI